MYHSLIISGKNTYEEWEMVPTSRPVVNPPEVKTKYVELPGYDSSIDYTDAITGHVTYGMREGSWEFLLIPEDAWAMVYSSLLNFLHGKKHKIILEDDPGYYYVGRLSIDEWNSEPHNSLVVINYQLEPYKYSIYASDDENWLWDNSFEDSIIYSSFNIRETTTKIFINNCSTAITPIIICSEAMHATCNNGVTEYLAPGENQNENIKFQPGTNTLKFYKDTAGSALVTVRYREVSL